MKYKPYAGNGIDQAKNICRIPKPVQLIKRICKYNRSIIQLNFYMSQTIVTIILMLSQSFFCFSQANLVKITNNAAEDFHPSFSADGEKILFDSEQSGHNEIYLYYIKTKKVKQLTASDKFKSDHPAWLPDGRHILFTYWRKGPERYIMNIDGSEKKMLFYGYGIASPKGDKISFISNKNGNYDMFIIGTDGKNEKQLTAYTGDEVAMNWSPDGKTIVFLREIEKAFQVCSINADGSGLTQLSSTYFSCDAPQWHPQGNLIAYSYKGDSNSVLCIVNKEGTVKKELTRLKKDIGNISWSPDGKQLICSIGSGAEEELAVINASSGALTQLTDNKTRDTYPSWSPDSKKILFVSEMDGDLDVYFFKLKK